MKVSIPGMLVGIIILVLGLVIVPVFAVATIEWGSDHNRSLVAANEFINTVIDKRVIDERTVGDLSLSLAACSANYEYSFKAQRKVVNPLVDPITGAVVPGKTQTDFVYFNYQIGEELYPGDRVIITVKPRNYTVFETISMYVLHANYPSPEITVPGRVR